MMIMKDEAIIRAAEAKDADILTHWWNDGEIMAHAGFPNGLNQKIEKTLLQIEQNNQGLSKRCILEVHMKPIGECNFSIFDHKAEIGIKICDKNYQNQGFGTIFLKMLIHYLFTDETLNGLHRIDKIILDTNLNNTRAQHVYEKLGFTKLRVNKDIWKDQLGVNQSSVDYEMVRKSYLDSKSS